MKVTSLKTKLPGSNAPDAKTLAAVLENLKTRKFACFNRVLAKEMGIPNEVMQAALNALVASGDVEAQMHPSGRQYVTKGGLPKKQEGLVSPFKWDAWTKPMRGYDARMQAAMRMRSA